MELASIGIPKVTQAYMCVKRVAGPYERISYNKEEGLFNTIVHEREKKLRTSYPFFFQLRRGWNYASLFSLARGEIWELCLCP